MADIASPKTQHEFNMRIVEALRLTQAQIAELQARATALEDGEAKRALVADADGIAEALTALAGVMPFVPPATREEAIALMKADGDADPEGTARMNYPALFADPQPAAA